MPLLLSLLIACKPDPEVEPPPPLVAGPPVVGAAEGTLNLPIGTPLGGFSARARYLGGAGKADNRKSAYTVDFVPSAGVHTRPGIKVIWIANGDQDLVLTQTDTIYSYDGLVTEITRRLEAETGRDLEGRVIHATNHSHNSYGPFSDQTHFYLGGDKFNPEIFERFVGQVVDVALRAYESRQPAAIGSGWVKDWDPDDTVYRDRRPEDDALVMFEDLPPGGHGKDPYLNVLRFDALDGTPIAMTYAMPIHGTAVGEDSALISSDAGGGITHGLESGFDRPVVVMQLQSAGGDASPAGRDGGLARVESLGELARPGILDLWARTPTSSAPITLETVARHIPQGRDDIRVTRNGTVDWSYRPYEEGYQSDDTLYGPDGALLSPFDEFNAPFGAVFCGAEDPLISAGNIGASVYPYNSCVDLGLLSTIITAIFDMQPEEFALPMPESLKAGTAATRLSNVATLRPDGTQADEPLFAAFFPAEPTSHYVEQMRRRAWAELDFGGGGDRWGWPLIVGYSQDHEGYFLPPEDWLLGGYEPNINVWGPLQAEHVMEGVLAASAEVLTSVDVAEPVDPDGRFAPTTYPTRPLPTVYVPDETPNAGEPVTEAPADFWLPEGFTLDLTVPAQVPRVAGVVQFAWEGGDAMVDLPRVVLERQDGDAWVEVTTASGRPVDDRFADLILAYTPDPLYPVTDAQAHRYWVAWQAVPHDGDRLGLPVGTYRLRVDGQRYIGGATTWPWPTAPYQVVSPAFQVVPAEVHLVADGADGLWADVAAPPSGWRYLGDHGQSTSAVAVGGPLSVTLEFLDGSTADVEVTPDRFEGTRAHLAIDLLGLRRIEVTDAHGNSGTWSAD